jgi:hypothetical protein
MVDIRFDRLPLKFIYMDQFNERISAKLAYLLALLEDSRRELDTIADEMPDKALQVIVHGIADENSRSIRLLNSVIGDLKADPATERGPLITMGSTNFSDMDAVFNSCHRMESVFVNAYRDILNQWFPNENLRRVLQYQLNGIKSGFMKLKLFTQLKKENALDELVV